MCPSEGKNGPLSKNPKVGVARPVRERSQI